MISAIVMWLILGLILTLATQWLAARISSSSLIQLRSVLEIASTLLWIAIVAASGILAGRYIERISYPAAGYLIFGAVMSILSVIRALLLMHTRGGHPLLTRDRLPSVSSAIHTALYLLPAVIVYFVLAALLRRELELYFLLPACFGALLPDLDTRQSLIGRLAPFISRPLASQLGHRQEWHSLAANALVAAVTLPLVPLFGWVTWALISLGFLAHLTLDVVDRQGLMLFWPLTRHRYYMGGAELSPGTRVEQGLLIGLLVLAAAANVVSRQAIREPAPLPAPTYDDTVRRYLGLRGRNLVFADVDGTWQSAGQRVYARLEILNVLGSSFVMFDRTTGAILTAGRAAEDNLYLNAISLAPGADVRVKPVELHLSNQPLADLLPVVYRMQEEPGLQYIFISGDLVLPARDNQDTPLAADYSQSRLRKITRQDDGHFVLRYLTAGELIALADVEIEMGTVVIVATYSGGENAATATPLPPSPHTAATPDVTRLP